MDKQPPLTERVTPQMRDDLFHRRITTRALAAQLGVSENRISRLFPGKIPGPVAQALRDKRKLKDMRHEFRCRLALDVIARRLTVRKASEQAHCTERSMYRYVAEMRAKAPPHTPTP